VRMSAFESYYQVCNIIGQYIRYVTGIETFISDGAELIKNDDGSYTFTMTVKEWSK
jgi:hypothetical protein